MTEHRIEPNKVTKPMQLLAAWLVGLIVTNGIFLASAINLEKGSWERGALVVAAIVNVPLFLVALFVLQTRFRAELQEDTFYSEYLSKKTAAVVRIDRNATQDARLDELERQLLRLQDLKPPALIELGAESRGSEAADLDWSEWAIALNDLHPRFEEIREALRSAGIPLAEIFGNPNDRPPKWIISLSYHLPVAHKVLLLRTLLPFGFDGVQFWEPQREAEENEDVYIGSYGAVTYVKVTPALEALISKDIEAVDLNRYYTRHESEFVL